MNQSSLALPKVAWALLAIAMVTFLFSRIAVSTGSSSGIVSPIPASEIIQPF